MWLYNLQKQNISEYVLASTFCFFNKKPSEFSNSKSFLKVLLVGTERKEKNFFQVSWI